MVPPPATNIFVRATGFKIKDVLKREDKKPIAPKVEVKKLMKI